MTHYLRKPSQVEAKIVEQDMIVTTADGDLQVKKGDYLVKDTMGGVHPCKPNLFHFLFSEKKNNE